jgi:hypothetical protein
MMVWSDLIWLKIGTSVLGPSENDAIFLVCLSDF